MILDFGNALLNMGTGNWTTIRFEGYRIRFCMLDGTEWLFDRSDADQVFNKWFEGVKNCGKVIRPTSTPFPQDDGEIPAGY